jgi:ubiquinone/menaquinone biosynthesis C-methylase UbiE
MTTYTQRDTFLQEEGDAWYERNSHSAGIVPLLFVKEFSKIHPVPQRILEIGCSFGENLRALHTSYGCAVYGIDPSAKAVEAGRVQAPHLQLTVGTADSLPYNDQFFDCVIFGFCLYLCDRELLFKIAGEADRVLHAPGHLLIMDFFPPYPYRNTYTHKSGVFSYKMNYSSMFLWHPAYSLVSHRSLTHSAENFDAYPDERIALICLAKQDTTQYVVTDPYR